MLAQAKVREYTRAVGCQSGDQVQNMKKLNMLLAVIVTVFVSSLFPTLTVAQETPITTNTAWQAAPAIYGDRIVWADLRSGDWDIYMYNIETSTETQITTNTSYQGWPSIYGDRIVWEDDRNKNYDIYMYDLRSIGIQEFQITVNTTNQRFPAIYGDRIVWEDNRNGNWDIYLGDLAAAKETRITTNTAKQVVPAIWEDNIVWTDDRNGNSDIYMYNIVTSTETQVTTNTANQGFPAIYEDRIVWQDDRNGNWDIYIYNITTGNEYQITYDASAQVGPAIYGDRIVWRDERNANYDIYMHDITTGKETPVTTDPASQDWPAVYEDRIVWEDYRKGNADIYMYTIPPPIIESCDWQGLVRDSFDVTDVMLVNGSGFQPSTTYAVYVVNDVTWTDGMNIPTRVPGTATEILSDSSGNVIPSRVWNAPLTIGKYDILVDVNDNGKYDADTDAIDDNDIQVTAGLQVIPEFSSVIVMLFLATATLVVRFNRGSKHEGCKK